MPPRALATLVAHLVDYAGLFPPASRSMPEALAEYAGHRDAPDRAMLGRFVVPVVRLDELSAAWAPRSHQTDEAWLLAAIGGADIDDDLRRLRAFNERFAGILAVDVIESKAATPADVARAADAVGGACVLYVEIPVAEDPSRLLDAIAAAGVAAKIRTGGVTGAAFPGAPEVARFVRACAERRVRWKATAGLHHPLRAEYALTYASDAPRGTMFGFLNVFAAGAFARAGMQDTDLARLLEERDPRALSFDDAEMRWGDHAVSTSQIAGMRATFAASFGSCSVREPVDELHRLGYL